MNLLRSDTDERDANERTVIYYCSTDLDHHVVDANDDCGLVVTKPHFVIPLSLSILPVQHLCQSLVGNKGQLSAVISSVKALCPQLK